MHKKVTDPDTGREFLLYFSEDLLKELAAFDQKECEHLRKELRRGTTRSGGTQIKYQCLDCGELVGNAVAIKDAPPDLAPVDINFRDQRQREHAAAREAIYHKHIRLQRAEGVKTNEWYTAYLRSGKWASKRTKVFERANNLCEGCREREAKVVHHLTYEHIGDELLFELVALCPDCHARCHPERHTPQSEFADELGDDAPWYESRCNACRWGGRWEGNIEWCGHLEIPASQAQAGDDQCSQVSEPLR